MKAQQLSIALTYFWMSSNMSYGEYEVEIVANQISDNKKSDGTVKNFWGKVKVTDQHKFICSQVIIKLDPKALAIIVKVMREARDTRKHINPAEVRIISQYPQR